MKKLVGFIVLVCFLIGASVGGDVRISAKSSSVAGTEEVTSDPTWWDDVCSWVKGLF
ncbi:MAG: hypothetical protein R8G66_27075 [Cytophagales bacterium]|nr:hypothetical protein [Cytophagales bacterium]